MLNFIQKTFGGLSLSYYIRQFLFALLITAFLVFTLKHPETGEWKLEMIPFILICQFLYPYARFVYESIIGYILGDNVFFVNAILMLVTKLIMMFACYMFAIFIAPLGLLYLYFHHSKQEKLNQE